MSRTPRCHKASITALPIAAGAPIAPLSLAPLTPSGLLGAGVAMKVVRNAGRSVCPRHGVVQKARGQELSARAIIDDVFRQRLADALRQAAMHLALDDHRIDHRRNRRPQTWRAVAPRRSRRRRYDGKVDGLGIVGVSRIVELGHFEAGRAARRQPRAVIGDVGHLRRDRPVGAPHM